MVKEDPAGGVQPVALPIVHRDPVGVDLGGGVRAAGVKGGGFVLGYSLNQPVHLRAGGLVETGLGGHLPHGIEEPDRPDRRDISGKFRDIEADPHVALGGEVVNLFRLGFPEDLDQRARIAEITVMQKETGALVVAIFVDGINPLGVET